MSTDEGMVRVLVFYHQLVGSYAQPEPPDAVSISEALRRFAAYVKTLDGYESSNVEIHRFYAPSWEVWCRMFPLQIDATTVPMLQALLHA